MHNALDNCLSEASLDTRVFDPTSQRGSILLPLIISIEDSVFIIPINLRIQIFLQSLLLLLWISRLRGNRERLQFWWWDFEWHARYRSFWLFFPFTPSTRVIHEEKDNHAKEYSTNYSHQNKHCKEKKAQQLNLTNMNFYNLDQNSLKQRFSPSSPYSSFVAVRSTFNNAKEMPKIHVELFKVCVQNCRLFCSKPKS